MRMTEEEYQTFLNKRPFKDKVSKYRNKRTEVDGIMFDSKKEAKRYSVLKILEKEGVIKDLRLQVPYKLEVNGVLICTYRADFVYILDPQIIVEDCKGLRTPIYKLKRKLMRAIHNIEILET